MRSKRDKETLQSRLSRRGFLAGASIAGSAFGGSASADTLADVPERELGAPLSGHSERSEYLKLSRIPEAGPGMRHVAISERQHSSRRHISVDATYSAGDSIVMDRDEGRCGTDT